MGGRGASSGGGSRFRAPNGFRTIGSLGKIPVLRSNSKGGGLPRTVKHPNATYAKVNRHGKIEQIRRYDKKGNAKWDVDWNHHYTEKGKVYPKGTPHMHEWKNGVRVPEHKIIPKSIEKEIKPHLKNEGVLWQ